VDSRFPVTSRSRRAFTLLEALAASVVLAILVLGVCSMLSSSYEQSDAVQATGNSVMLARQLLDEITAKPMQDPSTALGPEPGMTSRSQYQYVTNYNGYADTSQAVPLLKGGSLAVTGSANYYTRAVTVSVGTNKPSIDLNPANPSDFATVTVKVTAMPGGQSVSIPVLVANYPIAR
jgi:Tfp pilus assembly protein PilV